MVSVVILTKNEELDLPGCIESVRWTDDVHVFDSFSSDRTIQIAQSLGAVLHQRIFDGYATQRNASLHDVSYKYPWVLILDADERVPPPLAEEIRRFVSQAHKQPNVVACRLRRRDFFMGRWLKHAQISPFYIRLVRPEAVRFEREINEVLRVDGEVIELSEPFDHFPFSKGLSHWIAKHNSYSSMEAEVLIDASSGSWWQDFTSLMAASDFNSRRYFQKRLFYRIPGRPLLKLAYMLVIRRAFLDGRPGLTYALLQTIYEYFISVKHRELRDAQ